MRFIHITRFFCQACFNPRTPGGFGRTGTPGGGWFLSLPEVSKAMIAASDKWCYTGRGKNVQGFSKHLLSDVKLYFGYMSPTSSVHKSSDVPEIPVEIYASPHSVIKYPLSSFFNVLMDRTMSWPGLRSGGRTWSRSNWSVSLS